MNQHAGHPACSIALGVLLALGCAQSSKPYKTAPVSGVIKLDGQPLPAARVTFLPLVEVTASMQSGPESTADTDASGRYSLKTVFGDPGASLGKNRVMISTRKTELDPANPDRSKEIAKERIPNRYFTDQSPLIYDVLPAGSKVADFELSSK
jgi:hypothetical protein